jgi:diacylglycerol kinase (ATP)
MTSNQPTTSNQPLTERLLIISPKAGSMTAEVEAKLRSAFSDYTIVEFDPRADFMKMLAPKSSVIAAGGDGTIGFVARKLADTPHAMGVISLGTFNNFARALGMPKEVDEAIEIVKMGQSFPVTLGRVDGSPFLEAAAIGLFGEAIALGEAAKDMTFGELRDHFKAVADSPPFQYKITGDIEAEGEALSLVFANTPSIGAQLPVGDSTPTDRSLELSIRVGESKLDLVGRLLASAVLGKHREEEGGQKFKRIHIQTTPEVNVYADNQETGKIGQTPAEIVAEEGGLNVLLASPQPKAVE